MKGFHTCKTGMEVEMNLWTKSAIAAGLAGAAAVTIWIAASAPDRNAAPVTRATETTRATSDGARTTAAKRPAKPAEEKAPVWPNASTVIVPSYLVTQPKLADRVQPLLQRGADIELAAQGFRTAEQFAAVAHAAHAIEVPFVVLKHHVLNDGLTLSKAIARTRPDVDANEHASKAVAAARADVFEAGRIGS